MTAALLATMLVLVVGVAARPRPRPRLPGDGASTTTTRRAVPIAPLAAFGRLRRPQAPTVGQLAEWCDALARAIRGGDNLSGALRTVAPPASLVATVAELRLALERGTSLTAALDALEPANPATRLVRVVLKACVTHGGAVAQPIDHVASELRGRETLAAERATNSAQARLSARVMTLLPVAMLATMLATSTAVRAVVATPAGVMVVAIGCALNAAGWLWMRRIIAGAQR